MDYSCVSDIKVEFVANLGETRLSVKDILKLEKGSFIDLKKPIGESADLYVNKRKLGKGEVIVYEKKFTIRINEILDSSSASHHLLKEI